MLFLVTMLQRLVTWLLKPARSAASPYQCMTRKSSPAAPLARDRKEFSQSTPWPARLLLVMAGAPIVAVPAYGVIQSSKAGTATATDMQEDPRPLTQPSGSLKPRRVVDPCASQYLALVSQMEVSSALLDQSIGMYSRPSSLGVVVVAQLYCQEIFEPMPVNPESGIPSSAPRPRLEAAKARLARVRMVKMTLIMAVKAMLIVVLSKLKFRTRAEASSLC